MSIALTKLSASYERLSGWINYDEEISGGPFRDDFSTACLEYLDTVDELMKRGADAYLTSSLDEELQSFTSFVRDSMDTQETHRIVRLTVLAYPRVLRYFGFPLPEIGHEFSRKITGKQPIPSVAVSMFGFKLGLAERIFAAKIESRHFEARIRTGVPALKALIKEVTLGAPVSGLTSLPLRKS